MESNVASTPNMPHFETVPKSAGNDVTDFPISFVL